MLSSWRNRAFENDMLNLVNDDSKSIQPYYIPRAKKQHYIAEQIWEDWARKTGFPGRLEATTALNRELSAYV